MTWQAIHDKESQGEPIRCRGNLQRYLRGKPFFIRPRVVTGFARLKFSKGRNLVKSNNILDTNISCAENFCIQSIFTVYKNFKHMRLEMQTDQIQRREKSLILTSCFLLPDPDGFETWLIFILLLAALTCCSNRVDQNENEFLADFQRIRQDQRKKIVSHLPLYLLGGSQ